MATLRDIYVLEPNETKPPICSNLTGVIDSQGNIQLFWDFNFTVFKGIVRFEIDINNIRLLGSNNTSVLYPFSLRSSDGIGIPLTVTVWAISAFGVYSDPFTAVVTPVLVPNIVLTDDGGIKGIKTITEDYTVLIEDSNYVLIVENTNPILITVTFPDTLNNGTIYYLVNDKNNNARTRVLVDCVFEFTSEINNIILKGFAVKIIHTNEGKCVVLGNNSRSLKLDAVINIIGNQTLESNKFYEVLAPSTLTFPADPVEGDVIGIVDSDGDFSETNFVTLQGNGNTIEGNNSFILDKRDDNIQFYFNGFQWIYISRFFYIDQRDIRDLLVDENNSVFPLVNVGGVQKIKIDSGGGGGVVLPPPPMESVIRTNSHTLSNSDYKKWIKVSGTSTVTVHNNPTVGFECIIQNIGVSTITLSGITESDGTKIKDRWRACHVFWDGISWTAVGALEV